MPSEIEQTRPMRAVGLVLAGAVAKGAFGAGVVSSLAQDPGQGSGPIRRIAATSSGALNASLVAAGVATGRFADATAVLEDLWLRHGAWEDIAHVTLGNWFHERGLLDTSKLAALVEEGLRSIVGPFSGNAPVGQVKLTLVATGLKPLPNPSAALPTYERAFDFAENDFLDSAMWPAIAKAAAASATFPGLFAPTVVDGVPCVDGGVVNNTPISYAMSDPAVDRVFIVSSEASVPSAEVLDGVQLAGRITDITINERIAHDLDVARKTNERLRDVVAAFDATGAAPETRKQVLAALGWRDVDLVLIHPDSGLSGTSFSGFVDGNLRKTYIDAGARAARTVLDRLRSRV